MQRQEPVASAGFLAAQFHESWSRSVAVGMGRQATNPVEKLDSHGCASHVEKINLSDRARIGDRDGGKG
jgi:hypothetical protein